MKSFNVRFAVLILIAFTLGCSEFLIVGILNDLALEFSKPVSTIGLLVTIFAFVYAICTPLITMLISKFKYYHAMIVLLLIYILGNILSATSINYSMLVISRVITAAVSGSLISIALTYGNAISTPQKRPVVIAWIFSGFSIATVVGVPVGTYISTISSWHIAFWVIIALSTVTLTLAILSLPQDLKSAPSKNGSNQLAIFKDKRIIIGLLIPVFVASATHVFNTFMAPIFTRLIDFNNMELSFILFIIGVISIISSQLAAVVATHGGLKLFPYILTAEIILFMLMPFSYHNSVFSVGVILTFELVTGLLGASITVHFFDVAEESYPQSMVLAASFNPVFFNLGISIGSATGSLIVSNLGLTSIGFGSTIYAVISLIAVIILNKILNTHKKA
ncbi:chloramphenicol resistance protein [Companilactobacillus sp. RD055328]|uniref:MFS transporter n=1 Tax=Companilactobacillus sp. RD055328 TaxID=2916634 RepID=UPI001FC852FF|nr:MFS transporter [Companilactobacillus sp. RD055328]GKQ43432.1 chloramphenicol resistance protein [Companilactobacillus sp. RD055328]